MAAMVLMWTTLNLYSTKINSKLLISDSHVSLKKGPIIYKQIQAVRKYIKSLLLASN